MENKMITRSLYGVSILIFVVTVYFFYGMITNGRPSDFDPEQLGLELLEQGKASPSDYRELGEVSFNKKVSKLDSNIKKGVGFAQVVLYIAAGLMIIFLIYGLFITATKDIKKAYPSLIFVGITIIAFIWAFMNAGDDVKGFDYLMKDHELSEAKSIISSTNFWVNGVMIVFVLGSILLVVDLVRGIVKGMAK